jgi:hypothetical protein
MRHVCVGSFFVQFSWQRSWILSHCFLQVSLQSVAFVTHWHEPQDSAPGPLTLAHSDWASDNVKWLPW